MAGHADKKHKKEKDSNLNLFLYVVGTLNLVSIILYYFCCESFQNTLLKTIFFTGINWGLYKLFDIFYDSMFLNYIVDFLIIHLIAMVGVNFHDKFFATYLLIPAYLVYLGGKMAYNHVKSIDQSPAEEAPNTKANSKEKKKRTN